MILAQNWSDYEVIDTSDGEKLERWGRFILLRPDPQVIWKSEMKDKENIHAVYHRSSSGGGKWVYRRALPESWTVSYGGLTFRVRPTGFKHTGLFPEQAANWDFIGEQIRQAGRPIKVLNLFAYTGGATAAAAQAGASVCHVDASKGMVAWAKENLQLSGLGDRPVRFIVDDVLKFVQREYRRQSLYDGIIMDPPSYGRGPKGEIWKLENELFSLIEECTKILSSKPLFFLVNSYTTGLQPAVLSNILRLTVGKAYEIARMQADELGLPVTKQPVVLPCGATARVILGRKI